MPSPPLKKRRLSTTKAKSISPPPLRRKPNPNRPIATINLPPQPPSRPKKDYFRIYSWNVNGITHLLPPTQKSIKSFFSPPSPQGPSFSSEPEPGQDKNPNPLRAFLRRHHYPQFIGLQEVQISPKDTVTQQAVEKAANGSDDGPKYTVHFSLPRNKYNATGWGGKVYGVCTLLQSDVSSSPGQVTKEVAWDLEGRVLITELPSLKLVVVNAYWINGTLNPYRSPKTGEVEGTRHDRKREFHALMLREVKGYEGKEWDVVLVGDMNVAPALIDGFPGIRLGEEHVRNRKDFNERFLNEESREGMKGVDTWRFVYGIKRGYSYHGEKEEEWGRSCDRVDLGIVSRGLIKRGALVGAEIWESVEERGGSDHVPICVVLSIEEIKKGAQI